MSKLFLVILFLATINGVLNAQVPDSISCRCDSLLKSKIISRLSYELPGRMFVSLAKPENNTCEVGQFVIEIVVNREGQVIDAKLKQRIQQ